MNIVKHGNRVKNPEIYYCPTCGCEFYPDTTEVYKDENMDEYAHCPECITKVYSSAARQRYFNELHKPTIKTDRNKRGDEIISELMDMIDFEKIHNMMKAVNWTWALNNMKVPSVQILQKFVANKLTECWNKRDSYFSGGIFIKYYPADDESDEGLEFQFVCDQCGCFHDFDGKIQYIP